MSSAPSSAPASATPAEDLSAGVVALLVIGGIFAALISCRFLQWACRRKSGAVAAASFRPTPLPEKVRIPAAAAKPQTQEVARPPRQPTFPPVVVGGPCSRTYVDEESVVMRRDEPPSPLDEKAAETAPLPSEPRASDDPVASLVAALLRVLVEHRAAALRSGEPRGYGTPWWDHEPLRVADDDEIVLAGGQWTAEAPEEGSLLHEVEARRRERLIALEALHAAEMAAYGPRPTAEARAAEATRRQGITLNTTRQTLEAIGLLRARSDLLVHRLPLLKSDDEEDGKAVARLAAVIRQTPVHGTIDTLGLLPTPLLGLGVPTAGGAGGDGDRRLGPWEGANPFGLGSGLSRAANPPLLAVALEQVQGLPYLPCLTLP